MRTLIVALLLMSVALPATAADKEPRPIILPLLDLEKGRPVRPEPVLDGKNITVVAVFATWCEPCIAELPTLIKLATETAGRGVNIVGISVDNKPPQVVARWAKEKGINYRVFYADAMVRNGQTQLGSTDRLPVLVILSKSGKRLRRWEGALPEKILRSAIEPLLTPAQRQ